MYVCKECHDTDKNAIACPLDMRSHLENYGAKRSICEICGKTACVVYCEKYMASTKEVDNNKSCEICVYRTGCTKYYHAWGTFKEKASNCFTFIPENRGS